MTDQHVTPTQPTRVGATRIVEDVSSLGAKGNCHV